MLEKLFGLNHFPHHCQLKATMCERLQDAVGAAAGLAAAGGGDGLELPAGFVAKIDAARQQGEHRNLKLQAGDLHRGYRQLVAGRGARDNAVGGQ